MAQLNKWQKELQDIGAKDYKRIENDTWKVYAYSLQSMLNELKVWAEKYPQMSFSQQREFERRMQVAKSLSGIVQELSDNTQANIQDYLQQSGERAYSGVYYSMEGANNIVIPEVFINPDYVAALIVAPVAGKTLSQRLYSDTNKLAKRASQAILDGFWRGDSYSVIAGRLRDLHMASYNNSLRIIRTEGGRIQSLTTQKGYEDAKDMGIDLQKKWLASLDMKTRHDHRILDGQTVAIEDDFKVDGFKAKGPRLFGVAGEDINCRCTTVEQVKGWNIKVRRRDSEGREWDKQTYDKWKRGKLTENEISQQLTDAETSAVNRYISGESYALNDKLRRGIALNANETNWTNDLDSALDKLPRYTGNELIRTINIDESESIDFLSAYKEGKSIKYPAYTSTGTNYYDRTLNVRMFINSPKNGVDLRAFNSAENEVLYKRDQEFNVVSVGFKNGYLLLELDENV